MMKKWIALLLIMVFLLTLSPALAGNDTRYSYQYATLNRTLATRTGPGTNYDEPGSFLRSGVTLRVLSKSYDIVNEIWWVQVEFREGNHKYWAYTGAKRFNGLNLNAVMEERVIGSCRTTRALTGYYGPSYEYKSIDRKIPAGAECAIYGYVYGVGPNDSDFIQIEFYDIGLGKYRRAWVPDWCVSDYYMYYGF